MNVMLMIFESCLRACGLDPIVGRQRPADDKGGANAHLAPPQMTPLSYTKKVYNTIN